jgi:hypothetical protein
MISIGCLIYRSTKFADSTWESLHEFTPHLHDRRARFFFVANDATPELKEHLRKKGYPFVCQENKHLTMDQLQRLGFGPPDYMHRVYRGWNRAILESEEQMVLISSDTMFSPGWLEGLERVWDTNKVVCARYVEPPLPQGGVGYYVEGYPNVYERNFGNHPDNFKKEEFLQFRRYVTRRTQEHGSTYGSFMLSRSKAIEIGLYPEGNLQPWIPGDRIFFERLANIGVEHLDALDSIVYHFREGEMNE